MLPALLFGIPVALLLLALGVRILMRAVRSRALPDAMVGVFFSCMGIGATPALLAPNASVVPPDLAPFAMGGGHFVMSAGFAALYLFVWRCFGAESTWRRVLALAGVSVLAMLWVCQGLVEQFAPPGGAVLRATALVRLSAMAWAFFEAVSYRGQIRRRARLGLADPVVANRFLLWCLWTGSMLGASVVVIAVRFLLPAFGDGSPASQRLLVVAPMLLLSTAGGLSLWLAFFPPRWYLARLRSDAPA